MSEPGSQFLHERNPNLHTSPEVEAIAHYLRQQGEHIPNEPADKITAYMDFRSDPNYVNDGILTGNQASINRQIHAHIIKASDIPENYFDLQRRIAREQGHGDIEITPELRQQITEAVQADQSAGLRKWVEYLGGQDGSYPNWFKTYTWESVLKLGAFDKDKHEFQKRSRGTTAPFPELNREALAYVFDALESYYVLDERQPFEEDNPLLQTLLKNGNFGKLYAHAVLEVTPDSPELKKDTRGSWTKYNQTLDPRTARRLSHSLQGHGTGWCTAGESTAKLQLEGGDFYVYYTRDEEGKETIPRVAIRMEYDTVAEVRGVNAAQELEPQMIEIASRQLQELPGGEAYIQKAEDMKRLTELDKKISTDPQTKLNPSDLRFLYELDKDIIGFGYDRDPRINELKVLRKDIDRSELTKLLPEILIGQFNAAFEAYRTVAEKIQGNTNDLLNKDELLQLLNKRMVDWENNGTIKYMVDHLINQGTKYTLVASPNMDVENWQLTRLINDFRWDQNSAKEYYKFTIGDTLSNYSSQELSGKSGSDPVRFILIPHQSNNELHKKSLAEKRQILHELQVNNPELNIRVPSVLDAVTLWHAARAKGIKFEDWDQEFIDHFNLKEIEDSEEEAWVNPYSDVQYFGGIGLVMLGDVDEDNNLLLDEEGKYGNGALLAVG